MQRCTVTAVSPARRWVLVCILAFLSNPAWASGTSVVGQLDPNDPQDVFLYQFTLSAPGTVAIQTWGYGGTQSAAGGTNAKGTAVSPGGFDPYLTVFAGGSPAAVFRVSNDDGACPPGTLSAGACRDATLSLPALPAGTYTLALSTFENMSFAENLGTGTLADGFIGLGSFGGRTSGFAVDISGPTVVVPALSLGYVPNALTFGSQTLNVASGPLTLIVTNTGASSVTLGALAVGGSSAAEFTVGGDCVGTLAVAATCVINVIFRPTAIGLRVATLALNSNASGSPAVINLHGTGTNSNVASAAVTATDLDFGDQPVDTPHARTLVVTNAGGAPLVFGVDAEAGSNPAEFALTDNCAGQTIAPGATCTVLVVFMPAMLGSRSATLTLNSNAGNNPLVVTLRGAGALALAVPTLSSWSLLLLALTLGWIGLRRNRRGLGPRA